MSLASPSMLLLQIEHSCLNGFRVADRLVRVLLTSSLLLLGSCLLISHDGLRDWEILSQRLGEVVPCLYILSPICVYICIYIYRERDVHIYIYIYIYTHLSLSIYIYICIHICIYIHIHTYIHRYIHTYIHRYIDT